jgi:hypothetical protein
MIEGRGTVVIKKPAAAVLAFVCDLEKYKRADWKIGRVYEQRRLTSSSFFMRHGGTLRGLPGPPVALVMTLDAGGAHYQSAGGGGVARFFLSFDGGFDIEPVDGGAAVRVTHVERFRFHLPWRLVAEPFLRAWIQRDVEAEVLRLRDLIEAEPG